MEAQKEIQRVKRTYNVDRVGRMPKDPTQRLSCLFAVYGAEKCAEFVASVDSLPSPKQMHTRRMLAYALVYGAYNETSHKLSGAFAAHACEFFGMVKIEESFTDARRDFLSSPSLPKSKQGASEWAGESKRLLAKLVATLRTAKKLGYTVAGTITIEAPNLPKKTVEHDGRVL